MKKDILYLLCAESLVILLVAGMIIFQIPFVSAADIEVGLPAENLDAQGSGSYTIILKSNPATTNGTINHIEIYADGSRNVEVASFTEVSTNNFTTRASSGSLSIVSGLNVFDAPANFTAFDINAGDYIGIVSDQIDRSTGGSNYVWYASGDQVPCTNVAFTADYAATYALFASGPADEDTTPPTYSNAQTNNTIAGESTLFSLLVNDNTALNPNGQYIFSTNNTGEWVNESAVNFTTTPNWANVTKTLNSTIGTSVGYWWYFKDNVGNVNATETYILTTTTTPIYTLNITSPTTASPLDVSEGENISIYFNYTYPNNTAYVISSVTMGNVKIGEQFAEIINNTGGTPNNTLLFCGDSCSGGDYTYASTPSCTDYILADSCTGASSCDGTDTVVDIWLNGTTFRSTDIINVTIGVMCYGTGDEIKIWYYNGSVWHEEYYDATCESQGYHNITDTITITSSAETQYIRGQVTYGTLNGDDQCYTGTYGDNDDIAFNIVEEPTQQFEYIEGTGWQVNVTAPNELTGLQDLFLNATYNGNTRNDTQTNAIDYGGDTTPPTYSNAQINNTIAGAPILFSLLVNDTVLETNGYYIFSTNNTGEWVNESTVNFTTTPNWANVTKTLNSTAGLTIGYMWYLTDNVGNVNATETYMLVSTNPANTWRANSTINASLPDIGDLGVPSVFYKDSTWYMIAGEGSGRFFGFNWTGSAWQLDNEINASLPDIGSYTTPYVFEKDGNWFILSGESTGKICGFKWNGTDWQANSTINASLPDMGLYPYTYAFEKDSNWYIIAGSYEGKFWGFNWTGSAWQLDNEINASLPDVGANSHPNVFQKDGNWFMIAGETNGKLLGFNWTGSAWQTDKVINASLPVFDVYVISSVFYKDEVWYLMVGDNSGKFYGYDYYYKEIISETCWTQLADGSYYVPSTCGQCYYSGDSAILNMSLFTCEN